MLITVGGHSTSRRSLEQQQQQQQQRDTFVSNSQEKQTNHLHSDRSASPPQTSFLTFNRHLPMLPLPPKPSKSKVHSSGSMAFGFVLRCSDALLASPDNQAYPRSKTTCASIVK